MTILAWQRGGAARGPAVALLHDWGADGVVWQGSGWIPALERAGLVAYVPDLPGHGESADVLIPPDAEPAAWTSAAILTDLDRLGVEDFTAVGHINGCIVASHLAVRAPQRVRRVVLIGCDDRPLIPRAQDVAAALRDPTAALWDPEASAAVAQARRDRRHHLPTLAQWAQQGAWPAAPRLGALRTPVMLAVGRDDPRRERAPRLAALFHDGHLVTVPGDQETAVMAKELIQTAIRFVRGSEPPA
ncbi:MAG: alpha/beta fold hydrolase [Nitriliruptorales bacterium]|nr:alpha/beta fold hydrolase [Nitriliruptorales bacterium]